MNWLLLGLFKQPKSLIYILYHAHTFNKKFRYSGLLIDIISKAEIKKQMRDVIFVEDSNGNLVKYVRAKSDEKPKRNAKPKCDEKVVPVASPPPSPPPPAPLKLHEIQQAKMPKCSVVLLCLSENEIEQIRNKLPTTNIVQMPTTNKDDTDSSAPESKWSAEVKKDGILVFRLKQFAGNCEKIVILEPVLLRNCAVNPLLEPLFVLGEQWLFDLDVDANLIIQLPERNGRREKFIFSPSTWNAWFGCDDNTNTQLMEPQIQNANENISSINTLSLMDVNTSEIQKFIGPNGDEMLAALLASSLFCVTQAEMNNSMVDNDENGYDASIEVSSKQFE